MGAIAIDAQFVYTVMPGCSAITRIDKRTLTKEVMLVPGVAFPTRAGVTQLAVSGAGLLCASPSDIFAIDRFHGPLPTHCPGPRPRASYRVAFRPIRERRLRAATATATAVFELFLRRRR